MWDRYIVYPFRSQKPYGQSRLKALLRQVMIRQLKSVVKEIGAIDRRDMVLPLTPAEVDDYNSLVCVARNNITITSLQGATEGIGRHHQE